MADREPDLVARIARGVADLDPAAWDALAGAGDPFVGHAFLSLLEASSSVGDAAGWTPLPILAEREGAIVAAAPAYLKSHSQGEYVFDHGWAEAWERSGQAYYPKLQVAVPFTPVPGRRLLGDRSAVLAALEAVTGSLTATLHCEADDEVAAVLEILQRKAGRVLFAGWPTGVAVTWSQHHGGPWPATTSLHTSVGATAIRRFLRPITFQDAPEALLPPALREDALTHLPHRRNGVLRVP